MRSRFVFRGMTDCVLALLAQCSEVLFDAQQNPTCARLYASTLLLNIHPAGFGIVKSPSLGL